MEGGPDDIGVEALEGDARVVDDHIQRASAFCFGGGGEEVRHCLDALLFADVEGPVFDRAEPAIARERFGLFEGGVVLEGGEGGFAPRLIPRGEVDEEGHGAVLGEGGGRVLEG